MNKALSNIADEAAKVLASIEKFKPLVENYLIASEKAPTALGIEALGSGHGNFVTHMRGGRDFRLSTVEKVLSHIAGNSRASNV